MKIMLSMSAVLTLAVRLKALAQVLGPSLRFLLRRFDCSLHAEVNAFGMWLLRM